MKLKNKKNIITVVVFVLFIFCLVVMEKYRHRGVIVFLQPHEYTREINTHIKKLDMLYAPFMVILPVIAIWIFKNIFQFLFSDYMDGKKYKILLVLLTQSSVFIFILSCLKTLLKAADLLYKTGHIIMPAYQIALPYLYTGIAFGVSKIIMKTIIMDYEKAVQRNSNYKQHLEWMQNIKSINEEERNKNTI
jgi:hypothetical protein